jgi:hypothetical protein
MPQMRDGRHFEEQPPFTELLKGAEFVNVQIGVFHVALVVQMHRDLSVPLNPSNRLDSDLLLAHIVSL